MIDPGMADALAAVFVPSMMGFLGALCFPSIREAVAARLRGHVTDDVDLAILSEIRALRGEVYALRSEVAVIARPTAPPALPIGGAQQRAQE